GFLAVDQLHGAAGCQGACSHAAGHHGPEEHAAGHLVGARSIPFSELESRLPLVVKNKGLPVILVCATGARAGRAVAIAKKLGYEQAQALGGGLKSWKEANLPVEKTSAA
ncbi:MAG: rhodanese-like domain-containing protein, partial [Haliea sp.]